MDYGPKFGGTIESVGFENDGRQKIWHFPESFTRDQLNIVDAMIKKTIGGGNRFGFLAQSKVTPDGQSADVYSFAMDTDLPAENQKYIIDTVNATGLIRLK